MGPVSAAMETSSKKRNFEAEKCVSWSLPPPGFSEPCFPVLPVLYYKQPYDSSILQNVKFCDDNIYWSLRARGVHSRPHALSNCDCFMSFGSACPGCPTDELDFHLAITRTLMASRGVITRDLLGDINFDCQFIQMVAVKLIIEYPHLIDEVERNAGLDGLFRDAASRRQFVERCVEFFVVYGLYSPKTHMKELCAINKARKWV